jgi:TatD DNase family protein
VIDTHAHLDACEDAPGDLVARAREAGVGRVIWVAAWPESWRPALELAEREDGVYAVLGLHPQRADEELPAEKLRDLLASERAVAVGETGLDFYRDYAPRDRQLALFKTELELAKDVGRAVVIHTRAAEEETLQALESFSGTVVMHCFSSPRLLPAALERGYYISFAGNVTYPKALELREAATQVPPDRLLIETDAPFLAPQSQRGRPNEPAFVVHTLAVLAETRGDDRAELEARIDANAATAFSLP